MAIDVPEIGVVVVPSALVARAVPAGSNVLVSAEPTAEAVPAGEDASPSPWDLRLELGLAAASGNTRTQDGHLVAAAGRVGDIFDNELKLAMRRASARAGAGGFVSRTKDHVDLAYDLRWKYRESWYAVANFQFFRDPIKDIDQRYTTGLGVGHTLWDEQHGTFKTDIGISQVFETRSGCCKGHALGRPGVALERDFQALAEARPVGDIPPQRTAARVNWRASPCGIPIPECAFS